MWSNLFSGKAALYTIERCETANSVACILDSHSLQLTTTQIHVTAFTKVELYMEALFFLCLPEQIHFSIKINRF